MDWLILSPRSLFPFNIDSSVVDTELDSTFLGHLFLPGLLFPFRPLESIAPRLIPTSRRSGLGTLKKMMMLRFRQNRWTNFIHTLRGAETLALQFFVKTLAICHGRRVGGYHVSELAIMSRTFAAVFCGADERCSVKQHMKQSQDVTRTSVPSPSS